MKKIFISLLLLTAGISLYAQADEKFKGWKKADTEHFTFIYENSSKETVEAYAEIADDAWNKIANIYAIPKNHFNVYVTDRTNTVNAFTYFSPTEIGMFTTPPAINDFGFRADWRKLFFTHELIHASNLIFEDKSQVPNYLFGSFWTTYDFYSVPKWALEGLTTVLETELTEGGRGRSPYFELQFKAPTVENSLISYSQIGKEQEPPAGQAYVMGYLIMRSIADRWGIQALADIERNRGLLNNWEQSVKLVTGCTAEEIYRDAKIALAKEYSKERDISDGITISPRTVKTNYSKPAIVYDDGSLIAMRTAPNGSSAIVKLNPAMKRGTNYIEYTFEKNDSDTVFEETVLFEGIFPESNCVTADENGAVYTAIGTQTNHILPGPTLQYDIYKWTKESGLSRLTKNGTYLQPSVSRDGKTLVAIRQYGLTYSLVKIDTETGKETILLQNAKEDYIQPAINDNGTKVAFLTADGTRAKICVLNLEEPDNYEVIYNGDGEITDPSYPSWNGNNLTFTDNKRGRLEAYEVQNGKITPVVADPAGVLWTYKNDLGIYYYTFAATGYVIKMKPASEWGVVPDYNGPSMPGKIMTFGALESDYPDFKPYEKAKGKDEPKHRSAENVARLANLPEPKTQLSKEKMYFPTPSPLLYLPMFSVVKDTDDSYFGFGAAAVFMTPKLQLSSGFGLVDFIFYPSIKNFSTNFDLFAPLGTGFVQVMLERDLSNNHNDDTFLEKNSFDIGYKHPVYTTNSLRNISIINILVDAVGNLNAKSPIAFAAFSDSEYAKSLGGLAGLDINTSKYQHGTKLYLSSQLLGLGLYDFDMNKMFVGFEADNNLRYSFTDLNLAFDFDANIRYADFPVYTDAPKTLIKFNGKLLDNSYPGRGVFQIGSMFDNILGSGLGIRIYEETYVSFGENSVDYITPVSGNFMNLTYTKEFATGLELALVTEGAKLAFGYSFLTDFEKETFTSGNFYFTVKADLFRM